MAKINSNKINLVNRLEQSLINLSGKDLYVAKPEEISVAQRALNLCLSAKESDWDRYSRTRLFLVTSAIFNKIVFASNSHPFGKSADFFIIGHNTLDRLLEICWGFDSKTDFTEKLNQAMIWIRYAVVEGIDEETLCQMLRIHSRFIYSSNKYQHTDYRDQIRLAKELTVKLMKEYERLTNLEECLELILEKLKVVDNFEMDVYDFMREVADYIPHHYFSYDSCDNVKLTITTLDPGCNLEPTSKEIKGHQTSIMPEQVLDVVKNLRTYHLLNI